VEAAQEVENSHTDQLVLYPY